MANQHFATRQTEDVSIIRAARRSATCDGGEGREIQCNLITAQNKSREDEQRSSATKEAGRMGDRLGQARPGRNPRVSFSRHSKAQAGSTRTCDPSQPSLLNCFISARAPSARASSQLQARRRARVLTKHGWTFNPSEGSLERRYQRDFPSAGTTYKTVCDPPQIRTAYCVRPVI